MSGDPPLLRCPSCGSLLTSAIGDTGMWECHYHLCHAVFPAFISGEAFQDSQVVAEGIPPYLPGNQQHRSKSL